MIIASLYKDLGTDSLCIHFDKRIGRGRTVITSKTPAVIPKEAKQSRSEAESHQTPSNTLYSRAVKDGSIFSSYICIGCFWSSSIICMSNWFCRAGIFSSFKSQWVFLDSVLDIVAFELLLTYVSACYFLTPYIWITWIVNSFTVQLYDGKEFLWH